jgi:hypothetical protein
VSRKRRATTVGAQGAGKLFLVFLVLVGINVYVFFFSPGNLQSVSKAAQAASVGQTPARPLPPPPAAPVRYVSRDGTVREAEGLGSALRRDGVRATDVDGALRALRPLLDFKRQIQAGQKYRLRLGPDGTLSALELRAPSGVYGVSRTPDGRLIGGKGRLASRRRPVHD